MLKVVMLNKNGKKGISPLIATVILVGFVVLVVLLVWLWSVLKPSVLAVVEVVV